MNALSLVGIILVPALGCLLVLLLLWGAERGSRAGGRSRQNGLSRGRAVRLAAWGLLFDHLYFQLNGWDILPAFVGWLMLYAAVCALTAERPTLAVLEGFAGVMFVWQLLNWPPVEWPEGLTRYLGPVTLVLTLVGMYFHFQFLTEMAALAEKYSDFMVKPNLPEKLLRARTACVVLQTAEGLTGTLPLEEGYLAVAAVAIAAAWLAFCLYAIWTLFALARGLDGVVEEIP